MSGFGTSQWGLDGYGVVPYLSIAHAYAISTHQVVVVLTKPPQMVSEFVVGDVRAIGSWMIERVDTGETLRVSQIDPFDAPLSWVVTTIDQFQPTTTTMRITAVGLKDAGGSLVQLPRTADFAGVTEFNISTPTQIAASRGVVTRDLANRPAPTGGNETNTSGTLQIIGGDYALVSGAEMVKKLIIRRLTATPGDFFHLPNYGCGLRVKEPLPGGSFARLKASIQRELLLEPDVATVSVQLTQTENSLTVLVKATMSGTGQQVDVSVNSQIGNVRL